MWEQSLIESKKQTNGRQKWWIFPLSLIAHGAVVVVIAGATFWYVEAVDLPISKIDVSFYSTGGPPPALGSQMLEAKKTDAKARADEPKSVEIVPESAEPQDSTADQNIEETAIESGEHSVGVPWGIDGGDPAITTMTPSAIPANDDLPVIVTPQMQQPVLIKRVEPIYPSSAIRNKITGLVILEAVITKSGTVENLKVLRSDHRLLEVAAIEAVQKWLYRPATLNGRPMTVYFNVTVHFALK